MLGTTGRRGRSYKERKQIVGRRIRRVILSLMLFTLYLFFSSSVSTPLLIANSSMEPSLKPGERILYSKLLLEAQSRFSNLGNFGIERGNLVIVSPPYYREEQPVLDYINPFVRFFTLQKLQLSSYSRPYWEEDLLVKRVIALPGDTVKIVGHRAYVKTPDSGTFVTEENLDTSSYRIQKPDLPPLWKPGDPMDGSLNEITLGGDEYFVLSDSRGKGSDSYLWGPLTRSRILGKVFFRYWPFTSFSFL